MTTLRQDLRFALRMLLKHPASTLVAVATLGLAIGANTAIFSVVNGALLRPLPFPEPDRLYQIVRLFQDGSNGSQSVPKFVMWRDRTRTFESMAAYDDLGSGFNLTGEGAPERVIGSRVTRGFFDVLRVRPAMGRGFRADEDRPGGPRVVVLSHGLWTRRFGADPGALGREIRLNDEVYTIVGVMPRGFEFPRGVSLWTPLQANEAGHEIANYLEVIGRLKAGMTVGDASAEMKGFGERYAKAYPDEVEPGESFGVYRVQDVLYGSLRPALMVLLGAVGFVLLIACVNLANLQLARSAARRREIALRAILGARRGRIVRQLLTESLLLGLAGGGAGLLVAYWTIPVLVALGPGAVRGMDVPIDATVLAFTAALSLLTGLLFGLVPAIQAARPDLAGAINEGSTRSTAGAGGARTRHLLVVSEVALAIVLLVGASLLIRSFVGLRGIEPGFHTADVLTMKLSLPEAKYGDMPALGRFATDVVERVTQVPGVRAAALAVSLPMQGGPDLPFTIEGRYTPGGNGEGAGGAQYRPVTRQFFDVLGIPLVRGRGFAGSDRAGAPLVAVINETAARKYWKDADPVGQRIWLGQPIAPELADPSPREIVGVVRDVREQGLDAAPPAIVYVPLAQMAPPIGRMIVRLLPATVVLSANVAPAGLTSAVERAIWSVDPDQPITNVLGMDEVVSRSLGSREFNMLLVGALAFVALVLAAVGIYGVLSYLVQQRTREIGVRVALGATSGRVLVLVLRQGLATVAAGVALGLAGAFGLTRLLQSLVYGVSVRDPLAFTLAPLALVAVALVSVWLPARRAVRVDPITALRVE
jgi:predicted permease